MIHRYQNQDKKTKYAKKIYKEVIQRKEQIQFKTQYLIKNSKPKEYSLSSARENEWEEDASLPMLESSCSVPRGY